MTKQIFFISIFVFAISCSNSKNSGGGIPGAGLADLSDTQEQSVLRFNQIVEDVSLVTQNPAEKNTDDFGGFVIQKNAQTLALSKAQQELVEKMDQAKQGNQCQLNATGIPNASSGVEMQPQESSFSIAGSQCPISFKQNITASPKQTGNGYSVMVKAVESFKSNKNSPMSLGLDITSSVTTSATSMNFALVSEQRVNLAMNMNASMVALSESFGQVFSEVSAKMTGSLQLNPQTGETVSQQMSVSMTIKQNFSDFKVVGYITATSPNFGVGSNPEEALLSAKYYINGKSVSEQEFTSVFGSFDMDLN